MVSLDGVLDGRGQLSSPTASGRRPAAAASGGQASRRDLDVGVLDGARRYGWDRPGPSGGDARAAPLAAAGETGQAEAVVGGDDRRAAQGELAGQLALGRQAGAGRQEPGLDGPGQRRRRAAR